MALINWFNDCLEFQPPSPKLYTGLFVRELKWLGIVSESEADFANKKISIESPIGKALIGKSVGDTVDVNTPSGLISFEILKIEPL